MSKESKIREAIESGERDANIRFDDACYLLRRLGFSGRIRGSHWVFQHGALFANIQDRGGKIPPYQAAQIRGILAKFK